MKMLTHGLLDDCSPASKILNDPSHPEYQKVLQVRFNGLGTPRFPTDEEIEKEERRLLLTFAFKDQEEIELYQKEMSYVASKENQIQRPLESTYKNLKHQLRSMILNSSIKQCYRILTKLEENSRILQHRCPFHVQYHCLDCQDLRSSCQDKERWNKEKCMLLVSKFTERFLYSIKYSSGLTSTVSLNN